MARRRLAAPTIERRMHNRTNTNPRGTVFLNAARLRQQEWILALERRAITAFEALGVLMTGVTVTCQTIMPPLAGRHFTCGDTGVRIYRNSVPGARSDFEGGPSVPAATLTGRTRRYGFHLDPVPVRRRAGSVWAGRQNSHRGARKTRGGGPRVQRSERALTTTTPRGR